LNEVSPNEAVPELFPILSTAAIDHVRGDDALVRGR